MIQFFVDHEGAHGMRSYLRYRGVSIADTVRIVEYELLPSTKAIPASSAIFAAVDQIGPTGRAVASAIGHRLQHRGLTVFNDPERVLCRYDLLEALHAAGINRFRARRASESLTGLRYPVFVRQEHRHDGGLSGILPNAQSLRRALTEYVLRGYRRADLLVVEFCDPRGADGLYRKYSALRIGERMLPRHVHVSDFWVSKSGNSLVNEDTINEERRYFDERPHDVWLWEVFRIARIEFGRIDYGIVDGVPQVWEINTNPTLTRSDRHPRLEMHERFRAMMEVTRVAFHTQFLEALRAIDVPNVGLGELPITIAPPTRRQMTAEARSLRRALLRIRVVQGALDSAPVQRLRGMLAPIAADVVHAISSFHHRRDDGHSEKPSRP
jgi:hypothetical protein